MFANSNVHKRSFTLLIIFKVLQGHTAFTISLFLVSPINELYSCLCTPPTLTPTLSPTLSPTLTPTLSPLSSVAAARPDKFV